MARSSVESFVPPEWEARVERHECPVCGKPREAFEPPRRKFCSEKCQIEYAKQWKVWADTRARVILRDKYTCRKCGNNSEKAEVRYKLTRGAVDNENVDWVVKNCDELICQEQDEMLRRAAELIEEAQDVRTIATELYRGLKFKAPELVRKLPRRIPEEQLRIDLQVDHITPIALGGNMWDEKNMQTLCLDCHKAKTKEDLKRIRMSKVA